MLCRTPGSRGYSIEATRRIVTGKRRECEDACAGSKELAYHTGIITLGKLLGLLNLSFYYLQNGGNKCQGPKTDE